MKLCATHEDIANESGIRDGTTSRPLEKESVTTKRQIICLQAAFGALVLAAAGCSGAGSIISPTLSVLGRYTLQTVNGSSLPYTISSTSGSAVEILSEEFTLSPDGTIAGASDVRVTGFGILHATASGTYTVSGQTVEMNVVSYSGGVTSSRMTYLFNIEADGALSGQLSDGLRYVYRK
jgi:hypothetical protein